LVVADFSKLNKTPFFSLYEQYGGKIIDFAGWALPVNFKKSILEEHFACRKEATLTDVSDMGELLVTGEGSLEFLQKLLVNDIAKGKMGRVIYSPMCNPWGGCVDDLMCLCWAPDHYMLVINAGNIEKDFLWAKEIAKGFPKVKVQNLSKKTAEVAIQGPWAEKITQTMTDTNLAEIKYYRFKDNVKINGINCLVSRTGYTAEDGFEIYIDPKDSAALWNSMLEKGAPMGLIPAGLGCRDTLRFEGSMPLYGQELDDYHGPVEAGLSRFVGWDKPDFIGKEKLVDQRDNGTKVKLVGFEMTGRGIARMHYPIKKNGEPIGYVTTGSMSPTIGKNLGMGYVPVEMSEIGTEFDVEIRGKDVPAKVIAMPFYRRAK
jgi:aminomethyltransferase